jgi:predicted membrane metal-binding protein
MSPWEKGRTIGGSFPFGLSKSCSTSCIVHPTSISGYHGSIPCRSALLACTAVLLRKYPILGLGELTSRLVAGFAMNHG